MTRFIIQNKFVADQIIVWTELRRGARSETGLPMSQMEYETFCDMMERAVYKTMTVANIYKIELI